jgi:hypothetical protein
MTTTPHATHHEPGAQSTPPSTRRLVRSGALGGAIATVCKQECWPTGQFRMSRSLSVPVEADVASYRGR